MSGGPLGRTDDWCRLSTYERDLRARYLVAQRNVVAVRDALEQVEDILLRYPSYAPAYVTLAECHRTRAVLEMAPPAEVVPKMRAACRHALSLDGDSAEAHAALAGVFAWEWNFTAAEAEYRLAVRSGPRDARTYQRYAVHLAAFGRFAEALECADRACDLALLSPACEHARGLVHYWMRNYPQALECAQRAVAIGPQFGMGYHLHGLVSLHLHAYDDAVGALERATGLSGASTFDRACQAYGLGRAGHTGQAQAILAELSAAAPNEYVAPLSLAHCHLGLGDLDAALASLERAYAPGAPQWPYVLAAPLFEPLFSFERFHRIVQRIGLPLPEIAH